MSPGGPPLLRRKVTSSTLLLLTWLLLSGLAATLRSGLPWVGAAGWTDRQLWLRAADGLLGAAAREAVWLMPLAVAGLLAWRRGRRLGVAAALLVAHGAAAWFLLPGVARSERAIAEASARGRLPDPGLCMDLPEAVRRWLVDGGDADAIAFLVTRATLLVALLSTLSPLLRRRRITVSWPHGTALGLGAVAGAIFVAWAGRALPRPAWDAAVVAVLLLATAHLHARLARPRHRRAWRWALAVGAATLACALVTPWTVPVAEPLFTVGSPAGAVALETSDGAAVGTGELQGRVVVLVFWSPSCGPCREELHWLAGTARRHDAERLAVMPCVVGAAPRRAAAVLEDVAPGLTSHAWRGPPPFGPVVPATVVLDREGLVRHASSGFTETKGRELTELVGRLLAEGAP